MCIQAGPLWDFGPWYCFVGSPRWRPSRRERTEELKDYIVELKEALEEAEERLSFSAGGDQALRREIMLMSTA
jgi:hypothetical protein